MPRGDGTGPIWGRGPGDVRGAGRGGRGTGRMKGTLPGAGPSGECVCPNCGARALHMVSRPCYDMNCPECGTKMVRE